MAIGFTTFPNSSFDNDVPAFVAGNALGLTGLTYPGQWNTTGLYDAASIAASGADERFAYDGLFHRLTFPNTSGTEFYFNAEVDNSVFIDWLYLGALSFGVSASFNVTVELYWDYSATAASPNWQKIQTWVLDSARSSQRLSAQLPFRYSSVPRVRLRFTAGTNFTPKFSEFMLGRFYQLEYPPRVVWDDFGFAHNVLRSESASRVVSLTELGGMYRVAALKFEVEHDTNAHKKLRNLWLATNGAASPCLFIDRPTSQPRLTYQVVLDPSFKAPLIGASVRQGVVSFQEVAPTLHDENAFTES